MLRRALCHHVNGALEARPCVGMKLGLFGFCHDQQHQNYGDVNSEQPFGFGLKMAIQSPSTP
jgi:hypothetical protein